MGDRVATTIRAGEAELSPYLLGTLHERARSLIALGFFFDFVETFTRIDKRPPTRDEFIDWWIKASECALIQRPVKDY
jgi:hypothetical protein